MGLIVKVKVSHYVCIHTDEQAPDPAFEIAEALAREEAKDSSLGEIDIEEMEIIGSVDIPGENEESVFEECRAAQFGCVA